MRLLMIAPHYSTRPIGGLRLIYDYANTLGRAGNDVMVLHPKRAAGGPTLAGWPAYRDTARSLYLRLLRPQTVPWIDIDKNVHLSYVPEPLPQFLPSADAILATSWYTADYVARAARSSGRKYYIVMDFAPWYAPAQALHRTWQLPLKKLTISSWLYQMVRRIDPDPDRVVNLPIGVNTRRFTATRSMADRRLVVAAFYGFGKNKAPGDLVFALERCRQRIPELEATVFSANSRRRPPRLPDWIRYEGNVTEPRLVAIYNEAAIFVSSSLADGFAFPPAEAMACGCAVATTDCGGNRDFAEHGVTALVSPPGDPEALASNVLSLLLDSATRLRLANQGLRRITAQFSTEASGLRLLRLLQSDIHSR